MMISFVYFHLTGIDSEKFLQGQLTCDTKKLTNAYTPCAICNLKGRVQFGLWVRRFEEGFVIVLSLDLAEEFKAHIKKYGAFSKISLSDAYFAHPILALDETLATFETSDMPVVENSDNCILAGQAWQRVSIEMGNYWITKKISELFQPQELRLHQRGGVDYDKGCYLGQEIVARLYFKASPKAYLHRVAGQGIAPAAGDSLGKMIIVNSIQEADTWQALVVARPEEITDSELTILPLPSALQAPIGRE